MKQNWDVCLAHVLKSEGGFSDHPSDPGGMTNLGVTKKVWEEWTGKPATEQDMRNLTHDDVAPLYQKRYWDAVHGDDLPSGVDLCVFDCAVNAGVGRSARFLQRTAQVTTDGIIGPGTMKAVQAMSPLLVIRDFCAQREMHYKSLPTFPTFGKGWMARLDKVEDDAMKMVSPSAPV